MYDRNKAVRDITKDITSRYYFNPVDGTISRNSQEPQQELYVISTLLVVGIPSLTKTTNTSDSIVKI
jgi:hypothetical protein